LPPSYYRGCWHEVGRDLVNKKCHNLNLSLEFYDQNSLLHSRDMAGSGFRPLSKIPHCCRSKASGPCLSPSVADHPLRSAKDLWLGEPLPHQLPNPARAHLIADFTFNQFKKKLFYSELNKINLMPSYKVDSHVLLTRLLLFLKFNLHQLKKTFNLHVLGLSLAFILSQDQTLFYFCN